MLTCIASLLASSYLTQPLLPSTRPSVARAPSPVMDETIVEKALAGELEEEGAENIFLSEVGWASYLDKQGQSYNMNEQVSKANDGYFTAGILDNPVDGVHHLPPRPLPLCATTTILCRRATSPGACAHRGSPPHCAHVH